MSTAIKEHGMLVVDWKAGAIHERLAAQTRRPLKVQPRREGSWWVVESPKPMRTPSGDVCSRIQTNDEAYLKAALLSLSPWSVGERLWFRETWRPKGQRCGCIEQPCDCCIVDVTYAADGMTKRFRDWSIDVEWVWPKAADRGNVPSIHMPRWACRSVATITEVRVEPVKDISREDAIAEGIRVLPLQDASDPSAWWESSPGQNQARSPEEVFRKIWHGLYGAESWESDYCWAISFKLIGGGE